MIWVRDTGSPERRNDLLMVYITIGYSSLNPKNLCCLKFIFLLFHVNKIYSRYLRGFEVCQQNQDPNEFLGMHHGS
ncbi:unnamed protein product [Rhizophagus irregularis]|nr:unnamed protein product [Rhizophagus irregularis]